VHTVGLLRFAGQDTAEVQLSGLALSSPDESAADRPSVELRRSADREGTLAKAVRGAAPISEYLAANASESFLKLSNRSLSEDDLRAVKALIKASKCLTTLDFTDSSIRNDGARIIAEVLSLCRCGRPPHARPTDARATSNAWRALVPEGLPCGNPCGERPAPVHWVTLGRPAKGTRP
jgi:hypothetical protein